MALATKAAYAGWGNVGCNYTNTGATVTAYLDGVTWGRDTGNAAQSKLRVQMNASSTGSNIVWSNANTRYGNYTESWSNVNWWSSGDSGISPGGTYCSGSIGCCYCICGSFAYWKNATYGDVYGNADTATIGFSAHMIGDDTGAGYYNLPDNLRVLPPVGLTVSFPTTLDGNISASLQKWSNNTNIGGTPTTYTGASYWNFAVDILDESGNYLAHKTFNTGETLSCNFGAGDSGWYSASALNGSAAATSSPYSLQAGKKYQLRVVVQNNMNQRLQAVSSVYTLNPPKPTIAITSIVYNPTTKKSEMCFTWSLAESALTPETLTYQATTPDGTIVASGTIKTITGGSSDSGTVCNVSVPTGDNITLKVTNTAGTSPNTMAVSSTTSVYSPVANAAFLGFDWDELRRTCTIRAEAPGAANCRIQAGYAANNYNIGNKLTSGEIGELVVKDLNHGTGQIMYLQATPESSDGHQYVDEIAKISVPIPNPILGLVTPSCEDEANGAEQKYIVDIVEHKSWDTCTPRWKNGDRVVWKIPCGDGTNPWRIKPVDGYYYGSKELPGSLGDGKDKLWVVFRIITLDPAVPVSWYNTPTGSYERLDENHIKMWSDFNGGVSYSLNVRPGDYSAASVTDYGNNFYVNNGGSISAGHTLAGFLGSSPYTPATDYNIVYWDDLQPDDDTWTWG